MMTPGQEEIEDGLGGQPPRRELDEQPGGGCGADTAHWRRERRHLFCLVGVEAIVGVCEESFVYCRKGVIVFLSKISSYVKPMTNLIVVTGSHHPPPLNIHNPVRSSDFRVRQYLRACPRADGAAFDKLALSKSREGRDPQWTPKYSNGSGTAHDEATPQLVLSVHSTKASARANASLNQPSPKTAEEQFPKKEGNMNQASRQQVACRILGEAETIQGNLQT